MSHRIPSARLVVCVAFASGLASFALAQNASGRPMVADVELIDAPPPPIAPATIARDARGRATIRAVRVTAPIKVDGKLTEEIYRTVPPASQWIQQTPIFGAPTTEPTDCWIFFDDSNLYISMM